MEAIKQTFQRCKAQNRVRLSECCPAISDRVPKHPTLADPSAAQAALVTYVTAGYPKPEDTPNVLVSMEKGGADVIELGVPFTDPIADGPTIQTANTVSSSPPSSLRDESDRVIFFFFVSFSDRVSDRGMELPKYRLRSRMASLSSRRCRWFAMPASSACAPRSS